MPLLLCSGNKPAPFNGNAFRKIQYFPTIILAQKTKGLFEGTATFAIRHTLYSKGHFADTHNANRGFRLI